MITEKFADEMLTDGERDNVAGGTVTEMFKDGQELYKRGLLAKRDMYDCIAVCDLLHRMRYFDYKGDAVNNNVYVTKSGSVVTREEFWTIFDMENGTKVKFRL